jgi:hypothetical protein
MIHHFLNFIFGWLCLYRSKSRRVLRSLLWGIYSDQRQTDKMLNLLRSEYEMHWGQQNREKGIEIARLVLFSTWQTNERATGALSAMLHDGLRKLKGNILVNTTYYTTTYTSCHLFTIHVCKPFSWDFGRHFAYPLSLIVSLYVDSNTSPISAKRT